MKTTKRFPPLLAAALLVVASAAALSGCAKHEQKPIAGPGPATRDHKGQAVTVIVVYDSVTKKASILDPDPDKKIFLRKNKDWAVWYSPAGLVYVSFAAESPFPEPPKHDKEKKILKSVPATKNGDFFYTAKLVLTGESEDKGILVDPRIEVME